MLWDRAFSKSNKCTTDCTINSQLSQWPIQINHACHGRMVYKIRIQLHLKIERAKKQESVSNEYSRLLKLGSVCEDALYIDFWS